MAVAEIVTIGTELLLGEITDTNSKYIARFLRDIGVDLYRVITVGDNPARITATLQEALMRADIVITTGGLGPTVDDPTRQAVADVFNVPLVFKEELWQEILQRFQRFQREPTENNRRQAYIPAGARAVSNPVGTAPAFVFELGLKTIISLPGVPREMEYLMQNVVYDYLKERYKLQETVILAHVVHTIAKGESSIDEVVGELEKLRNPTVGLLAHPGQTDIRITAKAGSVAEARQMIAPVLAEIRNKLGDHIYGENDETLDGKVAELLSKAGKSLAIIEYGSESETLSKLRTHLPEKVTGEPLNVNLSDEGLQTLLQEYRSQHHADLALGIRLTRDTEKSQLTLDLLGEGINKQDNFYYGGPGGDSSRWAAAQALGYLRRELMEMGKEDA